MRPPSYYASIVKSNTGSHHSALSSNSGSYTGGSSDYSAPRTSSQQLRSSFSSPSSLSYVNRSHLPFVPSSTLVAHCFTGAGSSTRPYGSSSPSSSQLSSRSTTAYALPYSYTSSLSSSSSLSRPASTKRSSHHYSPSTTSTSSSSGYSSSSSYLSLPSTSTTSSSSTSSGRYQRPTTTTTSSYYKPIRLRERPLLTQISRQINTRSAQVTRSSERLAASASEASTRESTINSKAETPTTRTNQHSSASEPETKLSTLPVSDSTLNNTQDEQQQQQLESNWSSDITRNISRNKYLIKFREFDKHNSSSARPSVDVEATIQLPPPEISELSDTCVQVQEQPSSRTIDSPPPEVMVILPLSEIVNQNNITTCDRRPSASSTLGVCEDEKPPPKEDADAAAVPTPKKSKNVKLKLKPIGSGGGGLATGKKKKKSDLSAAEATTTTTVIDGALSKGENVGLAHETIKPKKEEEAAAKTTVVDRRPSGARVTPPVDKREVAPTITKLSDKKVVPLAERARRGSAGAQDKDKPNTLKDKTLSNENKQSENKRQEQKIEEQRVPIDLSNRNEKPIESKRPSVVATDESQQQVAKDEPKAVKQSKPVVKKRLVKKGSKENEKKSGVTKPRKASSARETSPGVDKQAAAGGVSVATAVGRTERKVISAPVTPPVTTRPSTTASKREISRIRFREYNINDFNFLTVLGHGGWGFVILAELKEHDTCFAVKCIKKITIVEDDDYDSIMIERKVLTLGNIHPFICKLFCTFETPGYLFFVMEYCAGGDLMFHVQHEGKFSESRCRFYAAEIICAIRFLHNRHIIYRDLKLDNILLDARGHIRLVDFGMCQCRTYREEMLPSNFCGTPEYISPEIIKGVPYNHSVDWWSFGVLLYEMAVGKMPFRGNDENELLWNVCYEQIHYPMFLTKELTALLKLLLEREPTKRMGMATCKAGDIYDQPFFRAIDWKAVEELRVEPPFVPEVRSNRDVSNFDSDFTESTCELSPVDASTLARIDQKQFEKFPYTNPDIFIFDHPTHKQKAGAQ